MPKQVRFNLWLFCDFLEFSSVKSPKIFTVNRIPRNTNFKKEKSRVFKAVLSIFANFCVLSLRNEWAARFP